MEISSKDLTLHFFKDERILCRGCGEVLVHILQPFTYDVEFWGLTYNPVNKSPRELALYIPYTTILHLCERVFKDSSAELTKFADPNEDCCVNKGCSASLTRSFREHFANNNIPTTIFDSLGD